MKRVFALAVGCSMMMAASVSASLYDVSSSKTALPHEIGGSQLFAETAGQDNREDRRDDRDDRSDDRQDCRQAEGAGDDKRDCKQDARQDRNGDG